MAIINTYPNNDAPNGGDKLLTTDTGGEVVLTSIDKVVESIGGTTNLVDGAITLPKIDAGSTPGTLVTDNSGNVTVSPFGSRAQVVDVYPNFYTRPASSSTAGSGGGHGGLPLPRAIAAGERVLLMPTSQTWCAANPNQPTSGSTFDVQWSCIVTTSQLSYSISAIYYIPKA